MYVHICRKMEVTNKNYIMFIQSQTNAICFSHEQIHAIIWCIWNEKVCAKLPRETKRVDGSRGLKKEVN